MFYVPPGQGKNTNLRSDIHVLGTITLLNIQSPVFSTIKTSFIQNHVISSVINNSCVLCIGPQGSGKTSACLLAALQLIKDKDVAAVCLTPDVESMRTSFEALKRDFEVTFDHKDSFQIGKMGAKVLGLEGKVVIIDNAPVTEVLALLENMKSWKVARVVVNSDEKMPVPEYFTERKAKLIEIKSLKEEKKIDKRTGHGKKWTRGEAEATSKKHDVKVCTSLEKGAKYVPPGAISEERTKAGVSANGKPRVRKEHGRKKVDHVLIQSRNTKEELTRILRAANLEQTWRSSDSIDAVAIYAGLRHTMNSIEEVLRSRDLKYVVFGKKVKTRDGYRIFVIPEGSKKPSNKKFDIVINYVFPETFEEYKSRAESARKVISFIENIDEGFKRSLRRLFIENELKIPSILNVQESSIEEFDAFHIETEEASVSDTDLWA